MVKEYIEVDDFLLLKHRFGSKIQSCFLKNAKIYLIQVMHVDVQLTWECCVCIVVVWFVVVWVWCLFSQASPVRSPARRGLNYLN